VNLSGASDYTYTWSPTVGVSDIHSRTPQINPDTSRTYTVTASYPGCSDSAASFHIDMQPYPVLVAGPDRIICTGDTAQLHGSAGPSYGVYTYTWAPAGAVDTPSKSNAVFEALVTTGMTLNVSTSAGCTGSNHLTVTVVKNNFLQVANDTSICPHSTVKIFVGSVAGDSLQSFYWKQSEYISDVTNDSPSVFPVTTTSFTVYGVDTTLCRDTATVNVSVKPGATISLPDTVTLFPGQTYQMSPLTNCNTFVWSPALGLDTTNVSNPVANPANSTRYYVMGTTEGGCVAYDTIEVIIAPDSYINIANAFVPGNGPDAVLKVLHLGDATLKSFVIFNRWGIKVFSTNDINQGWDGTYSGQPQPMGVYIYTVEAQTFEGQRVYKQGNVTLLR
jgi:gliding motility-associated-like protein